MRRLAPVLVALGLLLGPWSITPAGSQTEPSANARWVIATYVDVLGREPDPGGLDYWVSQIAAGGDRSREAAAAKMLFSAEGAAGEVDRAYADLLGRGAEAGGRTFWTDYLQRQAVSELRINLLASDEKVAMSGGIDGWIDAVYLSLIGRESDPQGRQFWLGQIQAGQPRYWVVDAIYRSSESLEGRTDDYYREVLGRSASAAERAAGAQLIRNTNERTLRARLLGSDERFEQFLGNGLLRDSVVPA